MSKQNASHARKVFARKLRLAVQAWVNLKEGPGLMHEWSLHNDHLNPLVQSYRTNRQYIRQRSQARAFGWNKPAEA